MALDISNLVDSVVGYPEGVNAGIDLLGLKTTQCHNAINMTFRGGMPRTRPTFQDRTLSDLVPYTLFQGDFIYSLNAGDQYICVLDGKLYSIDIDTGEVFCLTDIYELPLFTVPHGRCWFCQAEHFLIVQDGVGVPVIAEAGEGVRLAVQGDAGGDPSAPHTWEVPTGTIMAYGHGRLFVVPKMLGEEDGRRFFLAGDIMLPGNPSTVLQFTETQYLAGGGALALPNELGFITGMAFMRNTNTGDGSGPLVVFARKGASVFAVNAPRLTWQDIDIAYVLFATGGTVSPDAIIPVNGDIVFRATDGVRTVVYEASSPTALSNVPISGAFGPSLALDSEEDMAFCQAAVWDNYLLVTTQRSGDTWKGAAVVDLAPITVMGQVASPNFNGYWTEEGLHSVHSARVEGYPCLIIARRNEGRLTLAKAVYDDFKSIPSRLYTGSMSFQMPFELKQLRDLSLCVSDVRVESSIQVYFRPRGYVRWILAGETTVPCVEGYARIPFLSIPMSSGFGCDPVTGEDLTVADDFQFCFVVDGNLKIDKFRATCSGMAHGSRLIESLTGDRATFPGVELESTDFAYIGG